MDIRDYFQRVRQMENSIETPFVLVTSLGTSDGGKAGTVTEVTKASAARLIVDQRARLATAEEAEAYALQVKRALAEAEQAAAASTIQVAIVSEGDARSIRSTRKA